MLRRSTSMLLFAAVGVGAYFFLAPAFPKDQSVNVVLGDAAPSIQEVTLRYDPAKGDSDWSRQVTWRFDGSRSRAPRVVHHAPRLPDGDYVIAIEARGAGGVAATEERRVQLRSDSSTSIDVSEATLAAFQPKAEGGR